MSTRFTSYPYSAWHFAMFRIVLGLYLCIHFYDLTGYAAEIWSGSGQLPDPALLPTYGIFPNVLFWFTSPAFATGFLWLMFALAGLFTIGMLRPAAALLLWYGWTCLAGRNPFIANPGLPFVGLLLLLCVVIPCGEPLSLSLRRKSGGGSDWRMPPWVYFGVWTIMAVGYTISGLHKLMSPSWVDGTAIIHLLNNPLSRDHALRQLLLGMPEILLRLNTWGVLALEILFAPLCLAGFTRKWTWLAMIAMHLGILSLVNFADLTCGVLMVHLFTFDERWLPARRYDRAPVLFFDGVCGLCNRFVQFLFDIDREGVVRVATLQGRTASAQLPANLTSNLNSLAVQTADGRILTRSAAVLYILDTAGGLWRLLYWVGRVVPAFLSDHVYGFTARNRYRWFGRSDTCRMPTAAERGRFLE